MTTPRPLRLLVPLLVLGALAPGCRDRSPKPPDPAPQDLQNPQASPPPPRPAPRKLDDKPDAPVSSGDVSLQHRIAAAILEASPLADPADARARDAAAFKLSQLSVLLDASEDHILWSAYDPQKGVDPEANTAIFLHPLVWAKLYLSEFVFSGEPEIRQEGDFVVLELPARFRGGLDPGEHPHPFWHTADEWNSYAGTSSILLVFYGDRLAAAYHRASANPGAFPAPKWDGRWRWTGAKGAEQPRTAMFSYLLSPDNPHASNLDLAYRRLEVSLSSNKCIRCHLPDNEKGAQTLVLLGYPGQSLTARHSLSAVLREMSMPPGDEDRGIEPGIHDEAVRSAFIQLGDEFEQAAEAALKFEEQRRAAPSPGSSK